MLAITSVTNNVYRAAGVDIMGGSRQLQSFGMEIIFDQSWFDIRV